MSAIDIVRAWSDEEYRLGLSAAQLAALPRNPAGEVALVEPRTGSQARPTTATCHSDRTRITGCGCPW